MDIFYTLYIKERRETGKKSVIYKNYIHLFSMYNDQKQRIYWKQRNI